MKTLDLKDPDKQDLPAEWVVTLQKLIEAGHLRPEYQDPPLGRPIRCINPYTQVFAYLSPLAFDLYKWVINSEGLLDYSSTRPGPNLRDWNHARYIFNVCWPDEYYNLID